MAEVNNPFLELTEELNRGRLRALLSSGQAVVVHRLAIMSKDGDWLWPAVRRQIEGLPLLEAHRVVTAAAEGTLPFAPGPGGDS